MLIDQKKKFSESLLWKLQEAAYLQFGSGAWSEKSVPFYLTSNPWIANAYRLVVEGFVEDLQEGECQEPLYLYDLGAGSGRFAYLFLKDWEKSPIQYRTTDFVESNQQFLQNHLLLQPFFENKSLKAIDLKYPYSKALEIKGNSPIVLIANYYFDTLPQELYRVENGKLFQGYVQLETSEEFINPLDPELINHLDLIFSYEEIKTPISPLLQTYVEEYDELTFLYPQGALDTLDYFKNAATGPLVLLASDQAYATPFQESQQKNPELALHSSFSLPVSYRLIKKAFEVAGGEARLPFGADPAFTTICGTLGKGFKFRNTSQAFSRAIQNFDVWDHWQLQQTLEESIQSLKGLIRVLKYSALDPSLIYTHYTKIGKWIKEGNEEDRLEFLRLLPLIGDQFYPIGKEEADFYINLGVLCVDLKGYSQALSLFDRAYSLGGNKAIIKENVKATLRLRSL